MPSSPSRQAELASLIEKPFAHRGLHGEGRIENSRAAFEAAIAAGHGIELDVQASADGEAIVIHDYELARLTESHGAVRTLGAAELTKVPSLTMRSTRSSEPSAARSCARIISPQARAAS